MAPLPQSNTGRMWIDYLANGRQHTMMLRYGGAGLPTVTFQDFVIDFLSVCGPLMPTDWTFLGARVAVAGSDISNPFNFVPETLTGTYTPAVSEAPAFVSFVGRSGTGRRGRIFLLGAGLSPAGEQSFAGNYRVTPAELTTISSALQVLDQADFLAIDGNALVWNRYANLGYHAYWQKELRG